MNVSRAALATIFMTRNKHTETMFRNFYAEQKMTDPRDSWYKPNLLYNIHYRPPKPPTPPTPPKMMVVTKEFNPSVCSCGKHGCKPHYRMEREVFWSNKEVKKEKERKLKENVKSERDAMEFVRSDKEIRDEDSKGLKEKLLAKGTTEAILEGIVIANKKSSKDDEVDDDGSNDAAADSNDNKETDEEWENESFFTVEVDGIKGVASETYDQEIKRMNSIMIMADDSLNVCATSDGKEIVKKEDDNKELIRINADMILKGNSFDGLLNDLTQVDRPDTGVQYVPYITEENSTRLAEDVEDFGSAFGIMSVYCDSELHASWNEEN